MTKVEKHHVFTGIQNLRTLRWWLEKNLPECDDKEKFSEHIAEAILYAEFSMDDWGLDVA